jgi:hypothetical protein
MCLLSCKNKPVHGQCDKVVLCSSVLCIFTNAKRLIYDDSIPAE